MKAKRVNRNSVLFIEGEHRDLVALNWIGGSAKDRLDMYAEAYHKAASVLARRYGSKPTIRDMDACPIVFLYRHALELYLKAFLISGNKLLVVAGKTPLSPDPLLSGHRLLALVPGFERVTNELGWSWNMGVVGLRTRQDFVLLLTELDSVDQNSFGFRYPTDKQGKQALPSNFRFSMKKFATRMEALLNVLGGAVWGAEDAFEREAEARSAAAKGGA